MYDFPENEQFISCFYNYSNRAIKQKDSIILVTKDKNKEKHFTQFENPEYSFYVHDENYDMKGKDFLNYISFDDCKKITCRYENRYKEMSNAVNNKSIKQFYKRCIDSKDYRGLNDMHLNPEFHGSDVSIEDFYIAKFLDQNDYTKNNYGLSILSFDIEVDTSDWVGFPNEELAPCPVNMITAYNSEKKVLYIYALKYNTETFKEFRKREKEAYIYILKKFKHILGEYKIIPKYFDNELALIVNFFHQVNLDKPDYALAWNARFDFQTLFNRLKKLLEGTNIYPENVMCPEEFPVQKVYFKLDTQAQDISERVDLFQIFGYTNWIDAMCLYANITKPNGKKESYELDYIGEEETGMRKEEIDDIKTIHLSNYLDFYKYSAVDSLLLASILKNTGHVELLHNIVTMTRTRPNKALKKTVCLRNYADYFYNLNNKTISNNHSYLCPQLGTKIKGAFVALLDNIKKVGSINGKASNKLFDLVIDFDLSALYPSITRAFNISPDTMKYKITVNAKQPLARWTIKHGGESIITSNFFEEYISGDVINYCVKYHNYPDTEKLLELVKEKLSC